MIKELVFDDAILSTPCEAATAEDASVAQDLIDTLASIEGAACLAANQIGVTKALCVYLDESDKPHAIYNPKIMLGLAAFKTEEGCLTRAKDQKQIEDCTTYLNKIIRANGYKCHVKIFDREKAFLERLDSLNRNYDELEKSASENFKPDERYPDLSRTELVKHTMLALAL